MKINVKQVVLTAVVLGLSASCYAAPRAKYTSDLTDTSADRFGDAAIERVLPTTCPNVVRINKLRYTLERYSTSCGALEIYNYNTSPDGCPGSSPICWYSVGLYGTVAEYKSNKDPIARTLYCGSSQCWTAVTPTSQWKLDVVGLPPHY